MSESEISKLKTRNAELETRVADLEAAMSQCPSGQILVVDEAGAHYSVEIKKDGNHPVARLPAHVTLAGNPNGEPAAVAIARLHSEVEQLRPLREEVKSHENRKTVLSHIAAALGEVSGVNGSGPGIDAWYYKVRALLHGEGHRVPELRPGHLADIVQAMKEARDEGAPFRTDLVSPELLDAAGHDHPIQLWESYLAQQTPDVQTAAPSHLIHEICPRCQGFGGGPERIRLLLGEVAKRDREIGILKNHLTDGGARWDELRAAADSVAKTNDSCTRRIAELETQIQAHVDARGGAEKTLIEMSEYARKLAADVDGARTEGRVALETKMVEHGQALEAIGEDNKKLRAALDAQIIEMRAVMKQRDELLAKVSQESDMNKRLKALEEAIGKKS